MGYKPFPGNHFCKVYGLFRAGVIAEPAAFAKKGVNPEILSYCPKTAKLTAEPAAAALFLPDKSLPGNFKFMGFL
jgi:hypothetical protein